MGIHNLDTIYRKLKLNAMILPGEWPIVIKDLMYRVEKLEGIGNEETKPNPADPRMEEATPTRRRTSKVSKKKVSPS
jgi:hypothetical protein